MRFSTLSTAAFVAMGAQAYPGMNGGVMSEIGIQARQSGSDSFELLGDLKTLPDSKLSVVGKEIKTLLTGGGNPISTETYGYVPPIDSAACKKGHVLHLALHRRDHAQEVPRHLGPLRRVRPLRRPPGLPRRRRLLQADVAHAGRRRRRVHRALQHRGGPYGERGARRHHRPGARLVRPFHTKLGYPVSVADIIQVGATVATVTCPLGPRIKTYVGRKDSSKPNPRLLPP